MSASGPEAQALALFRAGRLDESERAWRSILERTPEDPQALHMLGYILVRRGQREAGLALLDRSIERAPRAAAFLNNRAQVLAEDGRIDEAIRDLRRAVQAEPRFAAGFTHLGILLQREARREEALAAFRRAIALEPRNALALYNLGLLLLIARDLAGAQAAFERVLEVEPAHAMALNNLGVVLRESGRTDAAHGCFERAVRADASNLEALNNLAIAQRQRGDPAAARASYARAIQLGAASPAVFLDAASVALDAGHVDESQGLYERALGARAGWADAEYGLGQVALRRHDFATGWRGYERRFETRPPQAIARDFSTPRLREGEMRPSLRLAVWSEQGVGDQVLFSTVLPELVVRGVHAIVEVDERLVEMYRRSLPALRFVSRAQSAEAFAACERQLPIGSLAAMLRPDAASFARQPHALLQPDGARVEALRERLGEGRWIAVSWRSLQRGEREGLAQRKSFPLQALAALARAGVRLLDVQYGDVEAERAAFERAHPGLLTHFDDLDAYADLEGVAAAMAACEGVVSVSNVTAHIAGAIGRKTWLLHPESHAPFSYWVPASNGHALWYPSVRIVANDMDSVVRELTTLD